ncbi:MAG: OB-fold nucleic acid binding domain-containing protein, partial [Lactobacillaceae bacterium]
GPMGQINTYIDHKKHKNEPYDPDLVPLKPIIASTYGVIVYQEQVMQVAHMMAGFPLSEADMLRRAMSKKNHRLLEKYQSKFIDGALKNGYSQKQAKKVYDLIEYFSNYGFNKSHSVAYSMLAFWLAYIKAHFPIHFFTVQLAYATGDLGRLRVFINSAKKRKIQVIAPNINQSVLNFSNDGQKIISGLIVIKGLRRDFISEIVKKRLKYGIYKDLNDFLNRLNQRFLKIDNFIPLIKAGACDRLHKNRRELLENLQMSLDSIKFSQNNITLFQQLKPRWDNYPDFSYEEKIAMEYDLTGLYLNGGPFDQFEELAKIYHPQKIKSLEQRKNSWLFVTLSKIRVIKDKNKQKMAFVTLDDAEDQIDGVVFANRYFDLYPNLVETKKVGVYGQLRKQKEKSFIINKLFLLSTAKDAFDHEKLFIDITKISNTNLQNLRKLLRQYPGLSPVFLIDNDNNKNVLLNPDNWVNVTNVFYRKLLTLVGQSHVVFQKERENENL